MSQAFLTLGDWTVRPDQRSIERAGCRRLLEPRWMNVLVYLAERAGQVVSNDELLAACWPDDAYGDNPVHKCMAMVRKALRDDARDPVYIATVRKRGYRVVAAVAFADGRYTANGTSAAWAGRSPYPGPRAFGIEDAPVFFGRRRHRLRIAETLRAAHVHGRSFLLVSGPEGCGATSLVHAGVAPVFLGDTGYEGLHARSYASMDASMPFVSCTERLAGALCSWRFGNRAIFAPSERSLLARVMEGDPTWAIERIQACLRTSSDVLLLLVDAIDKLLACSTTRDALDFLRLLMTMSRSGKVLVVATCHNGANAVIDRLFQSHGLADAVTTYDLDKPGPGEVANMIRRPAALAGVTFEEDVASERRLDDVILEDAFRGVVALPSIQRVMHSLFQMQDGRRMLTFDGYRRCGGRGAMGSG